MNTEQNKVKGGYLEDWSSVNIAGVRANYTCPEGKYLYSGQMVHIKTKITDTLSIVDFEPNHGFSVHGQNLCDVEIVAIVTDISFFTKLIGALKLFIRN